jgi:hypothetical membrane protein
MSGATTTHQAGSTSSTGGLPLTKVGAVAGLAGPALFTAGFLVHEAVRRGEFDPVAEPVSALEAGASGWIQQANFVLFGLLLALFAVALHRGMAPTPRGALGPALLGLAAFGLLLAAALPLREGASGVAYDPGGHFIAGVTFFLSSALALLVLSRRMARDARWRSLSTYAVLCGVVAAIGFVVLGRLTMPDGAPFHEWAGLLQRALIVLVTFPCFVTLAARLRVVTR